jgi:hypothetical protein
MKGGKDKKFFLESHDTSNDQSPKDVKMPDDSYRYSYNIQA